MRKYVIATHGKMASGIKSTLELLIGSLSNLFCINAYTDECKDPMSELTQIVRANQEYDIVIMTDMLGGSVNSNAMELIENNNVHVVTGINLAVVIAILMSDQKTDTKDVIDNAVTQAKEMLIYCNKMMGEKACENEDF